MGDFSSHLDNHAAPWRRPAALLLAVSLSAACGSTIQQRNHYSSGAIGSSDGLGAPSVTPQLPRDGTGALPQAGPATGAASGTDTARRSGGPGSPQTGPLPPSGPGSPVTVGIVVAPSSTDAAFSALGVGALQVGDQRAQAQAVVDDINARGGLAGHRIRPVFQAPDGNASETQDQSDQAMCDGLTTDKHVAFVLSTFVHNEGFGRCLARRGVPLLDDGLFLLDSPAIVPGYLYMPSGWALDRLMRKEVDALARVGFFKDAGKVGVLLYDTPTSNRVLKNAVLPRLAHYGKTDVDVAASPFTTDGALNQQGNVLKFRSDGVTRIINLAFSPIGFMTTAQSQGYHPRYAVDSSIGPDTIRQVVPAGQLKGAVGIGWLPSYDLGSGAAVSSTGRRCLALMQRAGQDTSNSSTAGLMTEWCDIGWFLQAAINASRTATPAGLATGSRLTREYVSAATFAVDMTAGRPDGLSGYKDLAYSSGCSCFQYVGTLQPAA